MAQQIQLRNDSTTAWETENPVLAQAEIGVDTTLGKFKIGDGVSTWDELDYYANEDLTLPTSIKDADGNDLIVFEKGNTGVARIHAVQDDLALRSANDIILYPGDDGPGHVYVNWGDATYTPDSPNRVATMGDVDEATGQNAVKYQIWGYPSNDAVAIMPATDGESIALKSSDAAAIRWHVRNGVDMSISPTSATVTAGDGYAVVFTIPEQEFVPPTGEYYYQISCPESSGFDAALYATDATTTSITFIYESDPGVFDATDAQITLPSVYAQFEVDNNGAYVKIADWTSGPGGYSQTWQFTKEGGIHFPYGPSNSRTGYGDVLRFASTTDQAIITGPVATEGTPTANRLVIAGQDGYDGTDGEGGDIYLWAGEGGSINGDGGDIKIDAGEGNGTGQGGYVKVRGGYSDDSTGGYVYIDGGNSANGYGGNIEINAGDNYNDTDSYGGSVNIHSGSSGDVTKGGDITLTTSNSGKVILLGDGGEFINNGSDPDNQIATQGYVKSAIGTYQIVIASDGSPLTGTLSHIGKLLYANLTATASEFVIPTNASVAFPVGSEIKFATSDESPWHISAADYETTTVWGEGLNYTYSNATPFIVPINSTATLLKVGTERWILSGLRLTD